MANSSGASGSRWYRFLPLLPLFLAVTSCLVIVSTAPTTLSGATIVFVAVDDHAVSVASLHVRVVDVAGDWRIDGLTGPDGSFHCGVRPGVTRVRADIAAPAGYALLRSDEWPRNLDVPGSGTVRVEIRVRSSSSQPSALSSQQDR
jgi:hypothetical protein